MPVLTKQLDKGTLYAEHFSSFCRLECLTQKQKCLYEWAMACSWDRFDVVAVASADGGIMKRISAIKADGFIQQHIEG